MTRVGLDDEPSGSDAEPPSLRARHPRRTEGNDSLTVAYERDYRRLIALAAMILGGPDSADDVVQDSYLLCVRRASSIDAPAAYLTATVINQCRNLLRTAAAGRRAYLRVVTNEPEMPSALIEFQASLMQLTEDQRIAIALRYYYRWSVNEIAAYGECEPATVRSRISRGLRDLRSQFASAQFKEGYS